MHISNTALGTSLTVLCLSQAAQQEVRHQLLHWACRIALTNALR